MKNKAIELVNKFLPYADTYHNGNFENAIQCALIAVDEIINNNSKMPGLLTQDTMHNTWFWEEVKKEIEKL